MSIAATRLLRALTLTAALAAITACSGEKDTDEDPDLDGDGVNSEAAGGDDCDDNNAGVFPGAVEVCDEVDQDCDGAVDEAASDATTWYADVDGDGFGDEGQPVDDCEQPPSAVPDATDCDDEDADTNPSAREYCDSVDDDCDGMIDEDALDALTFYLDQDGDGFGVETIEEACALSAGFSETDDDCDDANSDINPAAEEICDDGVDNDCSGDGDACELRGDEDLAAAPLILQGATSFNNIGEAFSAGDIDGDGEVDLLLGARTLITGEEGFEVYTGSAFLVYGPFDESRRLDEKLDPTLLPEAQAAEFGRSVAVLGDVNGDEVADLLISDPLAAGAGGGLRGEAWLFYGGERWSGAMTTEEADVTFNGGDDDDEFGKDVAAAGDVNGDGLADLLITAPGLTFADNTDAGTVFIVFGSDALPDVDTIRFGDVSVRGTGEDERAGYSARVVGDNDGDGHADLLIGTSDASRPAWLIRGPLDGQIELSTETAVAFVRSRTGAAEPSVAGAGDVDGDGFADLLIGSPLADGALPGTQAGETSLWYSSYGVLEGSVDLDDAHARFSGEDREHRAGHAVAAVGDVDGDGVDDVAVGAPVYGESATLTRGAGYLLYGAGEGLSVLNEADARLVGLIGDAAGETIAGAGDLNGDGFDDVWVGAPLSSAVEQEAGSLYLLYGGAM